jgi:DNA-binding winged helix-turn-helix (wHTH) protein
LQPRIMQVLVALAERRGEVVSHDELMARCWGGFAVSDDAIHRCIGRLRRLAEAHGGFRLETVPRVGYQLVEIQAPAATRFNRTIVLTASLAAGLLLVAAGFVGGHFL